MIKINGKSISELLGLKSDHSKNISVVNGKVIIDGQTVALEEKIINVEITGDVDLISADACTKITVNGNANTVKTQAGDIEVTGNVQGNVSTQAGNVRAGSIGGNASSMVGNVVIK